LKDQNRPLPEPPKKITLPLIGGFIIILFLFAVGTWFLLDLQREPSAPVDPENNVDAPPVPLEEEELWTPTPSFFDDFDDGIDPVWAVHYGDPFTVDGQLTSSVGAGLAAGDTTWKNYEIEFDVDVREADCGFTDSSNSVGLRVTNFDRAYWFVFTSCESAWSFYPGAVFQGAENLFAETRHEVAAGPKHIRINVEGTTMSAYENGALVSSIEDTSYQAGGMFLQVDAQALYDNFRVTLMP
jgi:hypothetical protein